MFVSIVMLRFGVSVPLVYPIVSIRAPTRGAIDLFLKIHQEQDTFAPHQLLESTNRFLGRFQSAHPCWVRWQHIVRFARSECIPIHIKPTQFRESVSTHASLRPSSLKGNVPILCSLRIRTQTFFGSSHHYLCCGCKISVVPAKRPSFGQIHVAQPSDVFDLARQSTASPNLSFGLSTRLNLQKL